MRTVTNIRDFDEQRRHNPALRDEMVWIPGGTFAMGGAGHTPTRRLRVGGFWIDRYPVTNARFRAFVKATGYVTVAERAAEAPVYPGAPPEFVNPGSLVFIPPHKHTPSLRLRDWWIYLRGADWRHPHGAQSTLDDLDRHPVVHITYHDAAAFARWAGQALPTEAQWEYAAYGGHAPDRDGGWMDYPSGAMRSETPWTTTPVDASRANDYGLHDMIGNVWEWTVDECAPEDETLEPRGLAYGASGTFVPHKVLKGGSYLGPASRRQCHCPAARSLQRMDVSASDVGFRCVFPVRVGHAERRANV